MNRLNFYTCIKKVRKERTISVIALEEEEEEEKKMVERVYKFQLTNAN